MKIDSFIVMCRVSGGMTGTRTGVLKEDGEVVRFETFSAAQDKADELTKNMNGHRGTASFQYWPVKEN